MPPQRVEILECTLRDGSYAVDFQFTPRDTATIALALEGAGIRLIEVGHGLGLNAAARGKGDAASSDEEYLAAVAGVLTRARWGMFYIPGIGRPEDLALARSHGMHFVRIGTNATEVEQARPHIEYAKKLGFEVCANLMKSYVLPPEELAAKAVLCERYGADMVCLVDSAGCMLPDDVRAYMRRLTDALTVPVGLHGHDNLSLGVANILTAVACGAQRVDTTLQGLGRGGGNAPTETVIAALRRMGLETGADLNRLMDIGQSLVRPMLPPGGIEPLHVVSGYAGFHSGFMPLLRTVADRHRVDLRELIVAVCDRNKVDPPPELVEEIAAGLAAASPCPASRESEPGPPGGIPGTSGFGSTGGALADAVGGKCREIRAHARKGNKLAVLNIVAAMDPLRGAVVSHFVQNRFGAAIGSVEVDGPKSLRTVIEAADGVVDVLLVDADLKPHLPASLADEAAVLARRSRVAAYSDIQTWTSSVVRQLGELLGGYQGRTIAVAGLDVLSRRFVLAALERGARVIVCGPGEAEFQREREAFAAWGVNAAAPESATSVAEAARGADALVSFSRTGPVIGPDAVAALGSGIVLDAGIGAVSREAVAQAAALGLAVIRPDMRAALAAELEALLGARRIVATIMGRGELAGVPVVAGGVVGLPGEVVVDSLGQPSKVLGICDGAGLVTPGATPEDRRRLEAVEHELLRRSIRGI